jgi:hypothetical protein
MSDDWNLAKAWRECVAAAKASVPHGQSAVASAICSEMEGRGWTIDDAVRPTRAKFGAVSILWPPS